MLIVGATVLACCAVLWVLWVLWVIVRVMETLEEWSNNLRNWMRQHSMDGIANCMSDGVAILAVLVIIALALACMYVLGLDMLGKCVPSSCWYKGK
jgi:hypothetical protein